jgi:tetratricopeptide (TPR) repeat protein
MAAGDLAGARKNYEESLAIRRRLSAADPGNADAQRDLVTSFQNLAVIPGSSIHWSDVVAQLEAMKAKGTLAPAGEKVLEFARGLSAADSSSAVAQRDVAGAVIKKGTMLVAVGDYGGARKAFEEGLTIARGLSAADPSNVAAQRGVATLLDNMASLLIAMGDHVGARKALEEDLVIARRLSAADPTNAAAQSIVSVALNKLGGVLVAGNDISGARKAYEESLGIVRRLSSAEPTNAEAQRDVAVSLWGLARIPGSGVRWSDVVAQMETMKSKGILNPADEKFIEQARQNAAKQNMP